MAIVMAASKLAELLTTADRDGRMYVSVLNDSRLALGTDPSRPTLVIDLSKERVGPYRHIGTRPLDGPLIENEANNSSRVSRRSGDYWFELNGRHIACPSLKELLARGLRHLEHAQPGMLDRLAEIKPRSRRIVARDPNQLFDKEHLVRDHAERLLGDWWYGTNNSAQQTEMWLRHACNVARLKWDEDFRISIATGVKADPERL